MMSGIHFCVSKYLVGGYGEVGGGRERGGKVHQACRRPGRKPKQQRQMLMRESAEQTPRLIQTAMGGKRMAIKPRKISVPQHILGT